MAVLAEVLARLDGSEDCASVADVVLEITGADGFFVFGEVLACPAVKMMRSECTFQSTFRLLELFAFGTFLDYYKNKDQFPALNECQKRKLKMLTVATLAASNKVLDYDTLQQELQIDNIRELEDLIIDCIYEGVIKAKLDQQGKKILIELAIARDLKEEDIDEMLEILTAWKTRSETVLATITEQKNYIRKTHAKRTKETMKVDEMELGSWGAVIFMSDYFVEETDADLLLAIALSLEPITTSPTTNDFISQDTQTVLSSVPGPNLFSCKMVMIARTDLKMGKGKIAAQCAHAAVDLYEQLLSSENPMVKSWKRYGAMKVVLRVTGEQELRDIYNKAKESNIPATCIRDAGRTQVPCGSTTVCALFGEKSKLDEITGHLKLL